jgi:alpha-glucosidase
VWFKEALRAAPGSDARARYIFREGRAEGAEPPNNWASAFGGPAWTRVTEPDGEPGQWYLHLFDTSQPDLDWSNPEVGDEFESTLRFWLDRGADGFRIDVANALAKHSELPDLDDRFMHRLTEEGHPHWDRDEVHEVYRRWRRVAEEYDGDRAFVAEAWLRDPDRLARYLRPDELHTAFNFHFLLARWDPRSVQRAVDSTLDAVSRVGAPATWVLSNHDVTRHVTRYGGGKVGERRARAAALLMLALPGSAYIYQGEELGLPEVEDVPDELRQDPTFHRTRGEIKGRDGCRVPMPWSGAKPPFGFTTAPTAWLPQPPAWAALTAEREEGQRGSMHTLYRDALSIRRTLDVDGESIEWIEADGDVLVFRRPPGFVCAVNFGSDPAELPASVRLAKVLTASTRARARGTLAANSAAWLSLG